MNAKDFFIKALAYFHRYGWIAVMLICVAITRSSYIIGAFSIVFAIWTLLGYLLKWKHIFCSFQNAYHKPMTPDKDKIDWAIVRKSDAYGIPAFFFLAGIGIIIAKYFNA